MILRRRITGSRKIIHLRGAGDAEFFTPELSYISTSLTERLDNSTININFL